MPHLSKEVDCKSDGNLTWPKLQSLFGEKSTLNLPQQPRLKIAKQNVSTKDIQFVI